MLNEQISFTYRLTFLLSSFCLAIPTRSLYKAWMSRRSCVSFFLSSSHMQLFRYLHHNKGSLLKRIHSTSSKRVYQNFNFNDFHCAIYSLPRYLPVGPDTGRHQRSVPHAVLGQHVCSGLDKDLCAVQEAFCCSQVQRGRPWICFTGSHSKNDLKTTFSASPPLYSVSL